MSDINGRSRPAVKPEGFTEYGRRQSPPLLRESPPVGHPDKPSDAERVAEPQSGLNVDDHACVRVHEVMTRSVIN
ncbi:MAG TPA: hypothetical protein VGL91_20275 [Acidobacteriota bacterium]